MWLEDCDFEFMIEKRNSNFFSFGTPPRTNGASGEKIQKIGKKLTRCQKFSFFQRNWHLIHLRLVKKVQDQFMFCKTMTVKNV